jgi:hypothetical protein
LLEIIIRQDIKQAGFKKNKHRMKIIN